MVKKQRKTLQWQEADTAGAFKLNTKAPGLQVLCYNQCQSKMKWKKQWVNQTTALGKNWSEAADVPQKTLITHDMHDWGPDVDQMSQHT